MDICIHIYISLYGSYIPMFRAFSGGSIFWDPPGALGVCRGVRPPKPRGSLGVARGGGCAAPWLGVWASVTDGIYEPEVLHASPNIYIYVYMYTCIYTYLERERERERERAREREYPRMVVGASPTIWDI